MVSYLQQNIDNNFLNNKTKTNEYEEYLENRNIIPY